MPRLLLKQRQFFQGTLEINFLFLWKTVFQDKNSSAVVEQWNCDAASQGCTRPWSVARSKNPHTCSPHLSCSLHSVLVFAFGGIGLRCSPQSHYSKPHLHTRVCLREVKSGTFLQVLSAELAHNFPEWRTQVKGTGSLQGQERGEGRSCHLLPSRQSVPAEPAPACSWIQEISVLGAGESTNSCEGLTKLLPA